MSLLRPKRFGKLPDGLTPYHRDFLQWVKDSLEILAGAKRSQLDTTSPPRSQAVTFGDLDDALATTTPDDYGAVGDGVTDDSASIQDSINSLPAGGICYLPGGKTYLIGSMLRTDDSKPVLLKGDGVSSIIKKGFDGDMLTLGIDSEVDGVYFDGNGATYTGRGIVISSGTLGTGRQKIRNSRIWNTQSYCVEYTAAIAGWLSSIIGCELRLYGDLTPCVKFPDSETNGNRALINVNAGHGPIVDFGGCNNATVVGCTAGGATGVGSFLVKNTNAATKIICVGNRFASGANLTTIYGDSHAFAGNIWAGNVTLASGSANIDFKDDMLSFTLTDSGTGNKTYTRNAAYTCSWTGATSNPAIGDGGLNTSFVVTGNVVHLSIELTIGGTTTPGTGAWYFSLPKTALSGRSQVGSAWMYDATGDSTTGIAYISDGDGTKLRVFYTGANALGHNTPYTWASGDKVVISISYLI